MIIAEADVTEIANQILLMRGPEQARLRKIRKYMRGKHDPPYAPRGVNSEYRWIMNKSRRNFLPLIVSVISQNLHVDGFKPTGQTTVDTVSVPGAVTDPAWDAFEANRMVSRQSGIHKSVIESGAAYAIVLPGQMSTDEEQPKDVPVIRPVSPRRMTAFYADDVDDEWPQVAIEVKVINDAKNPMKQRLLVALYDEKSRFIMMTAPGVTVTTNSFDLQIAEDGDPILGGQAPVADHGMGICPIVRFLYDVDLDGETDCTGEVEPILPIQDQINFDTFNLMMAEQYQAFRQRWVTGMAPVDEENREKTPFRPGVDRVWAAEDVTTKFGEFSETHLQPYIDVREAGIRHMATITQVPPYHLLGQVANLSAEALAAARDGLDRKVESLQAALTDPWRNVFRLTSLAMKDEKAWEDTNGQVVWRDTSARAFAATIDGLGKAATMLDVPVEELWRRIPGVTADDVNTWLIAKRQEEAEQMIQQAIMAYQQAQLPQQHQQGAIGTTGQQAQPGQQVASKFQMQTPFPPNVPLPATGRSAPGVTGGNP